MQSLILLLVALGTLAIFATTPRGREIAKRIGFRDRVKGAAPSVDVQFLLDACHGDRKEVARRVEFERARFSELNEAELYRRAIRRIMGERGESSE